jgi:hypothetical protein
MPSSKKDRARVRKEVKRARAEANEEDKLERARAFLREKASTERDDDELRRCYAMDRVFREKMTCTICYEKACSLSDDSLHFTEYGYNCMNGHIICFKCWFKYVKDIPMGTPWTCATCKVKVPYATEWPSGIEQGGGLRSDGGIVYYLQDGKKVICTI